MHILIILAWILLAVFVISIVVGLLANITIVTVAATFIRSMLRKRE